MPVTYLRKVHTHTFFANVYTLSKYNEKLSYRKETVRLMHNIEIRVLH